MVIACWAAKGGAGTTVVAASLALLTARRSPGDAVLVDLAGDAAACLGLPDPDTPGLADLLARLDAVGPDAAGRLLTDAAPGLKLLPRGRGPLVGDARTVGGLLRTLAADVVIDAGTRPAGLAADLARAADRSVLVTRACYLALRRAIEASLRPTDVVLVTERDRSLRPADVEEALGVPLSTSIDLTAEVARAVDAGMLARRLPRSLERALRRAA